MSSGLLPGRTYPLGASVTAGGVNFCVYSKNAVALEILLFDDADAPAPSRIIQLDPRVHRTFTYWHAFVPGLEPGQLYAYRAHGPYAPARGLRFDGDKLLLDPYGRGVAVGRNYRRAAAVAPGDNLVHAMKSVVVDTSTYDWEGDLPLNRPFSQTVIYELHVRGFTRHPSSGVTAERRGTYLGLIEKIPYLAELGITAVELLPVYQFDEQECPPGLANYWGYSPVSFFAAHTGYATRRDPRAALDEFRDMVKALHRAGIEVILDVVYNHTAEGGEGGPTLCFRGLENGAYYIPDGRGGYANFSGTGNTVNTNHAVVRRMIADSLTFWVEEMHVDGFRFDLASILSRDERGRPMESPPIIWAIESNPVLAGTKLIAEAWDAGGLYQVGSFVGDRWQEWNGRFRDDVRSFLRGDEGRVVRLAQRLFGSPDIYSHEERGPEQSINFVTCHDGFTLNDLVSYDRKHNEANGEDNRDGSDQNLSWNCGVEGPTGDPEVESLRDRQAKNFLALTLLAVGTPMLLMGDEMRRSQGGNNNAYCQDNETSWLDWSLLERHAGLHRFVARLVAFRQHLDLFREDGVTLNGLLASADIRFHGVRLDQPDVAAASHSLAVTVASLDGRYRLHGMINAYWQPLVFELPPAPADQAQSWRKVVDTFAASPADFSPWHRAPAVEAPRLTVGARSLVLLVAAVGGAAESGQHSGPTGGPAASSRHPPAADEGLDNGFLTRGSDA